MNLLVENARMLATEAHASIDQRRKYSNEPYIVHPEQVVLNMEFNGVEDPEILAAGWLHDVLEDVAPVNPLYDETRIELATNFTVLKLVKQLTDTFTKEAYPNLNRRERKRREAEAWLNKDPRAKTVKLADLIANTSDIVKQDPGFAVTYLEEKVMLLPYLNNGNGRLFTYAVQQLNNSRRLLGLDS